MSSSATALPLGAELVDHPDAPWTRTGAPPPPADPTAQEQARKWKKAVEQGAETREERHRRRAEERRQRREEAEAEAKRQLENNARRMYYAGFFLLPLVWLIALIYYREEHRNPDASAVIKGYYRSARFWLVVYTALFVAWFVVFQVLADSTFKSLNILYLSSKSPNGF